MTGFFKRTLSAIVALMLLVCIMAPLAAAAPFYFVERYTSGGGEIYMYKVMFNPGEEVYMRAVPYEGFTFFCWQSEDVLIQNPTSDLIAFIMPEKDVKVTAVFALVQDAAQDTVNVTFDTMGGSPFAGVDVKVGECVVKPETVPTRQGYLFDGWYADAICTLPFDFGTPLTAPTVIYAKWAAEVQETPATNDFSDVLEKDWFYSHVMSLAEKNVISGMGKGADGKAYFAPQANITRAQFVKILLNLAGENLYKDFDVASVFDDVPADAWYAEAVSWAYSNGVASGTGNGKFAPNSPITRQDMAVMIMNYTTKVAKKTLPDSVARITFADDGSISGYAKSSVETMQRAGIIAGKRNNHGSTYFAPKDNATRAETSKMIDVLLTMI